MMLSKVRNMPSCSSWLHSGADCLTPWREQHPHAQVEAAFLAVQERDKTTLD